MKGIGRFVLGVGAVTLGSFTTIASSWAWTRVGLPLSLPLLLFQCVVFSATTAALYTWSVDGPFVLRRPVWRRGSRLR